MIVVIILFRLSYLFCISCGD